MKQALFSAALFVCLVTLAQALTVYEVIQSDTNFSRLKSVLAASSTNPGVQALIDRLSENTTTTTFFALNNNALPSGNGTVTAEFLSYYLVDGTVSPLSDGALLSTLLELPSLGNQTQQVKITSSDNKFVVNGGSTVEQSLNASNGQVYGINANLAVPQDLWSLVKSTASLSTLKSLVDLAGVSSVLQGSALTAFAPVNEAFTSLPDYLTTFLEMNSTQSKNLLTKILAYHIGSEVLYLSKLLGNSSTSVPTIEGLALSVAVGANRQYTVNTDTTVQAADILASNGAANVVNKVLLPKDLGFTVSNALVGLADSRKEYVAALEKTTLLDTLNNAANPYTVFAPSAVGENPSLASLQYTIVPGTFKAADLKDGQLLTTLSVTDGSLNNLGQVLKVTVDAEKNVYVQGVKVTKADVGAPYTANGVIHFLGDALSLPGTVAATAAATPYLSTLDSAVVLAGLADALSAAGNLTVFAPTNDAFSALPTSVLGYLVSNSSKASNDALAHVLLNHVYDPTVLYYNNGNGNLKSGSLKMLSGNDVTVDVSKDGNNTVVKVNDANVTLPDVAASNGVVHVINGVLVPSDLKITNVDLLVGLKDTTLLDALNKTGLLETLSTLAATLFAPSNAAFDKLKNKDVLTKSDTADLKSLLLAHVVNGTITPEELRTNTTWTTLSGEKLATKVKDGKITVNVVGASTPSATIDLAASSSSFGSTTVSYVYAVDQVLGEKDEEESGLTSTEIGLIVAGCIVGVLLAGAAVGGAIWYYKRRSGYDVIDGDAY